MAKDGKDLIVGLDIGTSKIAAIVGEVTADGIDIIGIGTAPSRGFSARGRASSRSCFRPRRTTRAWS